MYNQTEDKDKLKKQDFALMVVEKIGDQTNQVIVAQGEDKSQKIAEASQKMQSQLETISSKSFSVFIKAKNMAIFGLQCNLSKTDMIKRTAD